MQADPFGFTFDYADFSGTSTNISASSTDSIIHGPIGNVSQVYWSGGTSMTLNPADNSSVKGVVYKSGSSAGNSNVMAAYGRYGSGKFAAIGDSSPTDDGTGNPTCTLYNGYWTDASGNHRLLLMNMTIWLAGGGSSGTSGIEEVTGGNPVINAFPNPSSGDMNVSASETLKDVTITVLDITGRPVLQQKQAELAKGGQISFNLFPGTYILKVESDKVLQTSKITVF